MAPELKEKTSTPAKARKRVHKTRTTSRTPRRSPKIPSGEENIETSMRTATVRMTMRKTKKWRPPIRSSWPNGIRNAVQNTGQMTYLRESKKISAIAISIATRTIGCRIVSEAPPPNLKFSGCISSSPIDDLAFEENGSQLLKNDRETRFALHGSRKTREDR